MPAKYVSNKDETIPLFENPWLERLTHIHPATPAVVFLPIVAWFLWLGAGRGISWLASLGLVLVGLFIWTLAEYSLHRWVFHYQPKSVIGQKLHFLMHGIHHDYPQDHTRLVMPPPVSLPLAALFWLGFSAIFGASFSKARMAPPVRSRARSSSTWPSSTSAVMTAAASKYTATVPSACCMTAGKIPGNSKATVL